VSLVLPVMAFVVALAGLPRWLRVAQREHYLAGRACWAWQLWLSRSRASLGLAALTAVLLLAGIGVDLSGASSAATILLLAAAVVLAQVVPLGLPYRGRTSPLRWTPRTRRIAALTAVLLLLGALGGAVPAAVVSVLLPVVVDLALLLLGPVETRLSRKYVVQARERMQRVRPTVIAITGSYGKTTTKQYLAHLLTQSHATLATPASFNNAMGLSRAVNEGLVPGTEVFVAEMGTYGPGEIRALCELFPPDIAVLTAIGEMHLERMKDRAGVLAAKSEITQGARAVVVNADDDLLRGLAQECAARGQLVICCSVTNRSADVAIVDAHLYAAGADLGAVRLPESVHPSNVACAVGAAVALGDDPSALLVCLASLPSVAHRLEPVELPNGSWILDDTYNSNPAGAREAVRRAVALGARTQGKVHVVTPGMVELGSVQAERNAELARDVADSGVSTLVVVGRTNAPALHRGVSGGGSTQVLGCATREGAVALLETRTRAGDVVLFENDLPDHYP